MKAVDMLKALGLVLCVAVASSSYAQTTDTTTDSSAASAKATAKTTKKRDRKMGLDVRKALSKAQGLDISNIFVRARGGAVVLTGSVPDGDQIPKAEEVAKGVSGVTSVSNKLTLGQPNGGGGLCVTAPWTAARRCSGCGARDAVSSSGLNNGF